MLTPEQIGRIVATRVDIMRPYTTVGEIKRNDRKKDHPWPEFWPGYNESVRERDELAVHIEYGVFPSHLIKAQSPNQTSEEFEYVKANFQQVTLPDYVDYENTIRRAMHEGNWSIEYPKHESGFSDYVSKRIGELGDFVLWAQNLLPKMKTLDPMGIICTMPLNIPTVEGIGEDGETVLLIDPDKDFEPQPIYFPVNRVLGYEHGVWYCLLTNEKSMVRKGGKEVQEGMVMWIVDDQKCHRVAQYGDAYKLLFDVTEYFSHEQGYPPCIFLMGVPTLKEGRVVYQSPYLAAKPSFDGVLIDNTRLMVVKNSSTYPTRVMMGNTCDYVGADMGVCFGGDLTYVGESGERITKGKCPKCHGTGSRVRLGPNNVLMVMEPKRGDTASTSVHDAMTFIEPTATTQDFLRKEIAAQRAEGRKVMHLSSEQPMVGGEVKTATQSGIDLKATTAFIKPVAEQIFTVLDFTLDSMAIQRYGKQAADGIYKLIPGTNFDLRTEADYIAELKEGSTLPPPLRQVMLEGYIATRYSGDQTMREAFDAIILSDRLFSLTAMEIASAQSQRAAEPWEVVLHNDALAIYERLTQDTKFLALDKFAKAEALRNAARQSIQPQSGGAAADVLRLVQEGAA